MDFSVYRLTGTCNHVAAVLFRVEAAVRQGLVRQYCTSLPCSWVIPKTKTTAEPARTSDIVFKQEKYGKVGKCMVKVNQHFFPNNCTVTLE